MFKLFKIKKVMLLSILLSFIFSLPVTAKPWDWKNTSYNFAQIKTILVKKFDFSYEYPDRNETSDKNYFEKYPHYENVIMSIMTKNTDKIPKYNFIYDIARTTNLSDDSKEPIGDAVLSIKIVNFGWHYQHHEGYWKNETVDKEEIIYAKDSSGKMREIGKKKTTTVIPVYHPPGYLIKDFAGAEFILTDAKTGEELWKHTDYRNRASNKEQWENNGPESMMNRIFSAAFAKMPFVKR